MEGARLRVLGENAVDGTLGGTGLLFTGGGSLAAGELNVWSWGSVRAPLLAVQDGTNVRCGALHMGSNAEEKGTLLVESGDLRRTVNSGCKMPRSPSPAAS